MGALPDGLVYDPLSPDPNDLLEIKCPAQADKITVEELCTTKLDFFLQNTDGQCKLKQKHNYYYQVQGQMKITNQK